MSNLSDDDYKSEYTLSIDDNNLIVYENDKKYVCKSCIDPKSKKTKRLLYAIKQRHDLSVRIDSIIDENRLEVRVQHALFDDDVYELYDKDVEYSDKSSHIVHTERKTQPLCYIYVLELEQNKYYIGKTSKPINRTGEHIASLLFDDKMFSGAAWSRLYPPVKILEVITSYDEFDEDHYTLRYMREKGIDNVRGGSFCELNLPRENIVTLGKMLAGADDKCYYCGAIGHFIKDCPQKNLKRVTQRQKKVNLKVKDVPKSKILKYYGAMKLLQNSELDSMKPNDKIDNNIDNKIDNDDTIDIEDIDEVRPNNTTTSKSTKEFMNKLKHRCRYCQKPFDSLQKKNTHEKLICTKNDNVKRAKMIDVDVDSILNSNQKYIKSKRDLK